MIFIIILYLLAGYSLGAFVVAMYRQNAITDPIAVALLLIATILAAGFASLSRVI